MVDNYCHPGEIQPLPAIHLGPRASVNSRLGVNYTEGAIIFYHSPNKIAVNICFIPIHRYHRFCGPYRTGKVKNAAAVTASPRVREIEKLTHMDIFLT